MTSYFRVTLCFCGNNEDRSYNTNVPMDLFINNFKNILIILSSKEFLLNSNLFRRIILLTLNLYKIYIYKSIFNGNKNVHM